MGRGPVWRSHFQLPIPRLISSSRAQLFFSGRDELNRSHGFCAHLNLSSSLRVILVEQDPVLGPGEVGAFDEDGAMPSSILSVGNELWMYYIGWKQAIYPPFRTEIGLAISDDGGNTFRRARAEPVLGVQTDEPFAVSQPCVWHNSDGFQMIYSSVREWRMHEGQPEPRYMLRRARSSDGLHWRIDRAPVLNFASEQEGGISRPTTLQGTRTTFLFYSYRAWRDFRTSRDSSYRLGFATSSDGETWTRRDNDLEFAEQAEPEAWDGLMQAYPAVFKWGGELFCFYSGDGFGRSGLGYARIEGGLAEEETEAISPTT